MRVDIDRLQHDPTLAEIVRRLVEAYSPERVYLFGSKARDDAGPDSDYDLLLVVPDDAPPERRAQPAGLPGALGCRRGGGRHTLDPHGI